MKKNGNRLIALLLALLMTLSMMPVSAFATEYSEGADADGTDVVDQLQEGKFNVIPGFDGTVDSGDENRWVMVSGETYRFTLKIQSKSWTKLANSAGLKMEYTLPDDLTLASDAAVTAETGGMQASKVSDNAIDIWLTENVNTLKEFTVSFNARVNAAAGSNPTLSFADNNKAQVKTRIDARTNISGTYALAMLNLSEEKDCVVQGDLKALAVTMEDGVAVPTEEGNTADTWTFTQTSSPNYYHIQSVQTGNLLTINNTSDIYVREVDGKYRLQSGMTLKAKALNLIGSNLNSGFGTGNQERPVPNEWFNLVQGGSKAEEEKKPELYSYTVTYQVEYPADAYIQVDAQTTVPPKSEEVVEKTEPMTAQRVTYRIRENEFDVTNYRLTGWEKVSDQETFQPGEEIILAEDTVFAAKFEKTNSSTNFWVRYQAVVDGIRYYPVDYTEDGEYWKQMRSSGYIRTNEDGTRTAVFALANAKMTTESTGHGGDKTVVADNGYGWNVSDGAAQTSTFIGYKLIKIKGSNLPDLSEYQDRIYQIGESIELPYGGKADGYFFAPVFENKLITEAEVRVVVGYQDRKNMGKSYYIGQGNLTEAGVRAVLAAPWGQASNVRSDDSDEQHIYGRNENGKEDIYVPVDSSYIASTASMSTILKKTGMTGANPDDYEMIWSKVGRTRRGFIIEGILAEKEKTEKVVSVTPVNDPKYEVTFVDEDGETVLKEATEYDGGTSADDIEKPADPIKATTVQYTYTFSGWTPEIAAVTDDATYTATYSETVNEYAIKFVNDDGTVLQSSEVAYGDTPAYTGATPTKEADAQYTYTFDDWDQEIVPVTGEASYTATYTATINKYKVTFMDDDDETVLKEAAEYEFGTKAEDIEKPADPTKATTAQYIYTFSGWTPEIADVTADATYTAAYDQEENYQPLYNLIQINGAWYRLAKTTIKTNKLFDEYPMGYKFKASEYEAADYDFTGLTVTIGGTTYVYRPNDYQPDANANFEPFFKVTFTNVEKTDHIGGKGGWLTDDRYDDPDNTHGFHRNFKADLYVAPADEVLYEMLTIGETNEWFRMGKSTIHAVPAKNNTSNTFKYTSDSQPTVDGPFDFTGKSFVYNGITYVYMPDGQVPEDETVSYFTVKFFRIMVHNVIHVKGYLGYVEPCERYDDPNNTVAYHRDYKATLHTAENVRITWLNDDGSLIDETLVKRGEIPTHADPTKAPDAQYTYTFAGWTPEIGPATENTTYTATYTSTVNDYTITFVDEDGTALQSSEAAYGETPSYTGETPTKAPNAQYTYTFSGWTPEIVAVTGDATYKATYEATVNEYTIKFLNEDGTELQSGAVAYGATPAYAGETPTKEADDQYTYSFAGWDKNIEAVTGDATYTATYTETVNQYTITFVNEDGTELQSGKAAYGATPAYTGKAPTKAADDQYTYTFTGWTPEIVAVTGDAIYKATYSATVNEYTIRFVNEDGTELQSGEVAYGETPAYTGATPTKAADAQYTYTFADWDKTIAAVTGDATYTATFTSTVNKYSYTIHHYLKGTTISVIPDVTDTVDYGTEISIERAEAYMGRELTVERNAPTSITVREGENSATVYYTLPLTIRAVDAGKTYGETDPVFTFDVSGNVTEAEITADVVRARGENVNTYALNVRDVSVPGYYNATVENGTFTIAPKAITVKADAAGKTYGERDPRLTATVDGAVGNDTIRYTVSREAGEDAGEYAITVMPGNNPNYTVTVEANTFAIGKKSVTISAENKTKVYDNDAATDPALTAKVDGAVGRDTINYTLARTAGQNVGEYSITVTVGDNPNYDVKVENGVFTITPKTITVRANAVGKTYGEDDPTLTAAVDGAVNGDTINYTVTRAAGEDAGDYAITVMPGSNPNYTVTVEGNTFTIERKAITVTANAAAKVSGTDDPALTATVTGLEGDDTITYSVTRAAGEEAGRYRITASGEAVQGNYTVTYVPAIFTITEAPETPEAPATPTYTLTVRYITEDGETVERKYTYPEGTTYNVTTPSKAGYEADRSMVTGEITEDTVVEVKYTKKTVTLTITFVDLDGNQVADPETIEMKAGDTYRFEAPAIEGMEALTPVLDGTMKGIDKTVIITYTGDAQTDETGAKVYTITGAPSVMINDYMTPLGIGAVSRGAGDSIE